MSQPKIQKTVPVRKNGYILELIVPPPGNALSSNEETHNIPQAHPQSITAQIQQTQGLIENPQMVAEEPVEQNSFSNFRNLFRR